MDGREREWSSNSRNVHVRTRFAWISNSLEKKKQNKTKKKTKTKRNSTATEISQDLITIPSFSASCMMWSGCEGPYINIKHEMKYIAVRAIAIKFAYQIWLAATECRARFTLQRAPTIVVSSRPRLSFSLFRFQYSLMILRRQFN